MELHEILSTLREEKDMKQHEVAEKVHVTKSAISSYGTGSSQPSYSVLVALADLYDVSIDFLLGRTQMRLPFHYFEQKPPYPFKGGFLYVCLIHITLCRTIYQIRSVLKKTIQ